MPILNHYTGLYTVPPIMAAEIASAREFYTFYRPEKMPWAQAVKLKNPDSEDSPATNWIFNEVFSAERFAGSLKIN